MQKVVIGLMLFMPVFASAQAADTNPPAAQTQPSLSDRLNALEQRLDKLEGAPANASISSFNPAMGMALDMVMRDHTPNANFDFRSAELNLEAAVDPFLKGWAVITGSNQGVDVEEAGMQTTSLPHGLTARAGRVFAPFGRFSQWHDHELPMVDRPNSLNAFVGGEAQADGLELTYLVPTPFFLEAIAGSYNKIGADNQRADNLAPRTFAQWTYLGRLHGYGDITDNTGFDLGVSEAWTPKLDSFKDVTGPSAGTVITESQVDSFRTLSGADLTLRYQPSAGGLYKGIIWTTEAMQDNERLYDPTTGIADGRTHAYAGYSNIETKLGRVVRVGSFADLTQMSFNSKQVTQTYAGYVTFEITEFDRIRLQYSRVLTNYAGDISFIPGTDFGPNDLVDFHRGNIVALQFTAVIGYHVHGFRGRWGA